MMKNFIEQLLDLIYRKKCYFCGKSKDSVKMCDSCYEKLELNTNQPNRIIYGVNIYCAGNYTKELQKLIRGLKYHKQKELAFYQAKFMFDYIKTVKEFENKDIELIPVPLHKNRIKKRKYNHMELVCEELSKLSGFSCNNTLIYRVKDTKPQYKLSRKQRLENLDSAFWVNKESITNKHLLIIDDICTTGATFEEMIKVLQKAKISSVTCLATSTPI